MNIKPILTYAALVAFTTAIVLITYNKLKKPNLTVLPGGLKTGF